MFATKQRLIPIYTTRGDVGAILCYPYIYNSLGEWIGWAAADRAVYSIYGSYVGQISQEWRIIRPRSLDIQHPTCQPPKNPGHINPPAHFPLPPLLSELALTMIDVLEEAPGLLPAVDSGDFKEDME